MAGGGVPTDAPGIAGGYLTGRKLIYPLALVISLFFLWGFSYGLLDVLNKHFQTVLGVTKLESTGLQVMYFGGGYLMFSPIAAEVMKRKGYKFTILMGLSLYSLGAIMFWVSLVSKAFIISPSTQKASFGGFLACTLVIACGLATLETAANSYAVVIGHPATASARLQFCQSWNGVASFVGPLIASKAFFTGDNQNSLTNVQYVYLAVACAGAAVGVLFFFSRLPEVQEAAVRSASIVAGNSEDLAVDHYGHVITDKPLYKEWNMIGGFVAQFSYVGAQVTCGSFFINYATENATFSPAQASNMLSYALITFTVGRFIATALATVFESNFLLVVYASCAIALNAYVAAGSGTPAVAVLIVIFFFMAPMYPTIFTLGTANLGKNTRRGAGILVMGVSGGAVFPPIQGAIADAANTRISFVVPLVGFVIVLAYVAKHWVSHGFHLLRVKGEKMVATTLEGGAVGGAVQTVHYDEKRLSVVDIEQVRRNSLGPVNPVNMGGYSYQGTEPRKDKRDVYYRLAKEQGWRARSAFKLLQLDEEFNLFEGVNRVVDLCAAPGSWSQVLSRILIKGEKFGRAAWEDKRYKALLKYQEGNGRALPGNEPIIEAPKTASRKDVKIVAIDLQPMSPLEGIVCLKADITHPSTIPLLLKALDPDYNPKTSSTEASQPVDLVISDGAPDVTGLHDLDSYVQSQLVWAALNLALCVLKPGGKFVAKVFRQGGEMDILYAQLKTVFEGVTVAKPRSSRASSVEAFIVCTNFRPPEGFKASLDNPLGITRQLEPYRESMEAAARAVRVEREDGVTELHIDTQGDAGKGTRWIAPFLACGDLSAFDADASHKLPEGHVSLDPVQPPTAPPYRAALEERKKTGGAYGKTKLGST
ncbi:hypothetical protein AC578_2123 [Pseudocercospora eumusae]|uniref:Putative tRNA (cytidine(32)/guanosine(34)-2'-O)-methyltransferase n=1 Tax=Pseudocercospora eumusae TaxID=321146 RepID=A0A139HQA9_9PEZI|nr:hypothetical protein AC578_2123 [Pseudocercospora eumusae]